MANEIGLGSGWSLAKETTYGTLATPDRALPFISESIKTDIKRIDSLTLKGGNYLQTSDSWRASVAAVGGDVQTLLFSTGAALLWEAMLGKVTTTGASAPYTHTFEITKALPSYSMDVTIGSATGTPFRKTALGCKVDSWEVALAKDANATLGLTWAAQSLTVATGALRGSYPAGQKAYTFIDGVVSGTGMPTGTIESIKFSGNNNLKKDEYGLGGTTIAEPVRNGRAEITGEMVVSIDGTTTDHGLYTAGTELSLVLTLTLGTDICTITTNVRIDGTTPTVNGDAMLTVPIPFKVIAATTDAAAFAVVVENSDATP